MSQYKLCYFNVKGLAEPIRIILSYMGKDFEDKRIAIDEWGPLKANIPFVKLPTLEIDGKFTCQSTAICKYLAVEAGLSGKNDWENLQIDMVVGALMDLHNDMVKYFRENDATKKQEMKKVLIDKTVPIYYGEFNERAKKNGGYIAINSLTWADIFICSYSECIDGLLEYNCLDNYAQINALKEKIYNLPRIKEWIEKRPNTR